MRLLVALVVLAGLLAFVPSGAAQPLPEPQCMQVYQEYDLGPVRVVRPNSCTTYVYVCDRSAGEAVEATNPADCIVTT